MKINVFNTGVVAQIFNLPYRRFLICVLRESSVLLRRFNALPTASRRYSRLKICATAPLCFLSMLTFTFYSLAEQPEASSTEAVARFGDSRIVTPVNQIVTPVGMQVELPGLRPQGLALSPNGKMLVTSGKTHELVVVSPETGRVLQTVRLPPQAKEADRDSASTHNLKPQHEGQLSFTGLIFSPDGARIYLAD